MIGKNDLDLLIERADSQAFDRILLDLGFKETRTTGGINIPGVCSFYGFDEQSEEIIHVHAHYQLIVGHDFTKNFHIPVERAYLASSTLSGLLPIPAPEFELTLLVIRLAIKHLSWDAVLIGHGGLSDSERAELEDLFQKSSQQRLLEIWREHFGMIDPSIFLTCLAVLRSSSSIWKRIRIGQKMMRCLAPFSRASRAQDIWLKVWRRFSIPFTTRILRQDTRVQIYQGGLLIAICGGDGAGKTTLVDGISSWLGEKFSIQKYHMGKPNWSFMTLVVRGILKLGRSLGLYPFQRTEISYSANIGQHPFPGYPWMIREWCTARDRYLTYLKARRFASNGGIVVLDRFPLEMVHLMDGAQIARMTESAPANRIISFFQKVEEDYYRKIYMPDLLIVLLVDPKVAVQRKKDEREMDVFARSSEIWHIEWNNTAACVVDANQPQDVVMAEVKKIIWSQL